MTSIEKLKEIIDTLEKTNYAEFDGDREEALDLISDSMTSMPNYVNAVANEQIMMPIIAARYEGQDYRDQVMRLDSTRRMCHDTAIIGINMLNRLCENLDLEPFAEIDTSDRHAVAGFVGKTVNEIYNHGIGNENYDNTAYSSFDKAVEKGVAQRGYRGDELLSELSRIKDSSSDRQPE